jgi:hypothetical protein
MTCSKSFLLVPLVAILLAGCASAHGIISGDKYISPRGWFSVQVPKSSNPFNVPFSIEEDTQNTSDANYDVVTFLAKDFGELVIAGVDYFSDDLVETHMKSEDHRTVLSNLSRMALLVARQGQRFPVEPKVVEEKYLSTPYGEALVRVYFVEKGSLLVSAMGRRPTAVDTSDTVIAVVVAMQKNNFIYAIAENDAESAGTGRNKEVLKERVQAFFASLAVHR